MTMSRPQLVLSVAALFIGVTVAFTTSGSAFVTTKVPAAQFFRPTSCLQAEGSSEGSSSEDFPPSKDGSPTDILSSPVFLKRKIEVLKSDIEEAEGQIAELKASVELGKAEWEDQLNKLRTEYSNIQERLGNQNKKGDTMATVRVAREMLSVLDTFDRAFASVRPETDEERAIEAEYKVTYEQILEIFKELGVETVQTVGKEFDYEYHQAVMRKPSTEYEEGIVCEEFAKGFVIGSTLIRAAMVAVAA